MGWKDAEMAPPGYQLAFKVNHALLLPGCVTDVATRKLCIYLLQT